ncbi:MAG: alpha/beta hydrolase [Oscillospiraceae bacterium]
MRQEQFFYPSAGGEAEIEAFVWSPDGEVRGVVQLVHGMLEHVNRYRELAEFLCAHGYAVGGNNHLGHGNSLIDGEPGYFGDERPLKTLLDDLDRMRKELSARFPDKPHLMLGHSMGSFLTRLYLSDRADGLAGAVLSGTSGGNLAARWVGMPLAARFSTRYGATYRSATLDLLTTGGFNKKFDDKTSPHNWISSVPEEVARYDADEQMHFMFTASATYALFDLLSRVSSAQWARTLPRTLPLLLISGEDDPVGGFGRGVRAVARRLKKAGIEDLTLTLYPGKRHELLHESNREEVMGDLLKWLDRQTGSRLGE